MEMGSDYRDFFAAVLLVVLTLDLDPPAPLEADEPDEFDEPSDADPPVRLSLRRPPNPPTLS